MVFYAVAVRLQGGFLNYTLNDGQIIRAKYQWIPANAGLEGEIQATCVFEYPETVPDVGDRTLIDEPTFDAFGIVTMNSNKFTMIGDGVDFVDVDADFPEQGGTATFKLVYGDGTTEFYTLPIMPSPVRTLAPSSVTSTTILGTLTISISSNKWFNVEGFPVLEIDVIPP